MELKALIFDFDGTLADTLPLCITSFQSACKKVTGRNYAEDEITRYFGISEEGIVKKILEDKWELGLKYYLEIYKENHHLYPGLFDGMIDILDFIKNNGYKLAMVTGKGEQSAKITLDHYGISNYFEYVETGSPEGSIKTQSIKKILSKWSISPENIAYIGDAISDILEAKEADVKQIAVSWASTSNHELLKSNNPSFIFDKTEDFKNWIMSLKNFEPIRANK